MRAANWLMGCALCIAGIGGVSAASVDSQDLDHSSRTLVDSASTHDSNTSSGGDAAGLGRDCPSSGSDNAGTTSNSSSHSGGSSSAPTPSRRPHLGWQSLLPGSIQ
ncbi:hypothetical protein PY254_17565 [Rhodanobacter sp. AS-Z3]|uniref:hypothetical protein n=1 Tax=Rhodanobacter sp. AS-Z3 TaxID=3031330 RepID=UPI0024788137|nr:hypothetical protein [Rhodanobacter sp. AS-Z3]WEN15012.1 hypothetical protein PY254_17565 [Rhodanobacter sp. AS-Z3]